MATDDIERLHYYQRQYLGAQDFEDQQAYHRDMLRRFTLAYHTWGIVEGLELKPVTNGTGVYITPGMAIDGYGREIVMLTPTTLDPTLFQAFHNKGNHTVCLQYSEKLTSSPQTGYGQCDQGNQFGRVAENFQVVVQDQGFFRDNITVNGQAIVFPIDKTTDPNNPVSFFSKITDKTDPESEDKPIPAPEVLSPGQDDQILPLDESVAYQEFPADDPTIPKVAPWLIQLGQVQWDGTTGQFGGIKEVGRHYIGSVASRLLTPARNLVVRDRSTNVPLPPVDPKNPDGVVMTIEGTLEIDRTLQVDGVLYAGDNIQLNGGALDFRDAGSSSDGKGGTNPLFTISRQGTDTSTGIDLRLQIGQDSVGKDRFVVGTSTTNLFWVADNGNAHLSGSIDGLSITGILDFGSQISQMITLWSSQDQSKHYGIGIQATKPNPTSATTYFRSSNDFYWFSGGVHNDTPGNSGGGTELMYLSASGSLTVNGPLIVNGAVTHNGPLNINGSTDINGSLDINGSTDINGSLVVSGFAGVNGLVVNGPANLNDSLVVYGPSVTFLSTTDTGFSVTLGQRIAPHGSDSIYGSPNLWLDAAGSVVVKQGFRIHGLCGAVSIAPGSPAPNPGDVVALNSAGQVIPSSSTTGTSVVGVVVDRSTIGYVLTDEPNPDKPQHTFVALMGIVQCNVDNSTNPMQISVGEPLMAGNNGFARTAAGVTQIGVVFGKAMEIVPALQQKTISVLIMPG